MNKLILVFCLLASLTYGDTIKLPGVVDHVVSSGFSSGSGEDVTFVATVLCKLKDGGTRMYVVTRVSVGRFFGMGRLSVPDFVDFVVEPKRTAAVWE